MDVEKIMKKPISISSQETVDKAAKLMSEKRIGSLLVLDKEGIITERDIMTKIVSLNKVAKEMKVEEVMTKELITVNHDHSIEHANLLMSAKKIRRLPIKKDGEIVGIITVRDISDAMNDMVRELLSQ